MAEGDELHLVPTDAEVTLSGAEGVFDRFLELTVWDVEAAAERSRRRSSAGTTWVGLYNVMMRRGFLRVEELGAPAARSWAAHLGVVGDPASAAEEPAAGAPPDL
jgi:hypothetical protein